ncbi:hypothetical protein ECZU23_52960 [Escherichia coli]|nr:hypothetical protein ECZU23_52960 [Escherichia coli]
MTETGGQPPVFSDKAMSPCFFTAPADAARQERCSVSVRVRRARDRRFCSAGTGDSVRQPVALSDERPLLRHILAVKNDGCDIPRSA